MNVKTHYSTSTGIACGRPAKRSTENVHSVTCLKCKAQPEFEAAVLEAGLKAAEAFANQTPATVRNQWTDQNLVCQRCHGSLFRSKGRSLDYFEYACAGCGQEAHILTETGMSR